MSWDFFYKYQLKFLFNIHQNFTHAQFPLLRGPKQHDMTTKAEWEHILVFEPLIDTPQPTHAVP